MLTLPAAAQADGAGVAPGYVGRIPVRNLWLLMLYASELFRAGGSAQVGVEDMPEDLQNLVAQVLLHAVESRQRRQLGTGFRERQGVLGRVRGRIDLLATERHALLERGRVACRFEELTVDTPRNRYVRAALQRMATLAGPALAHRCRVQAHRMQMQGVADALPTKAALQAQPFGRHDAEDRMMVAAAHMVFDMSLLTEEAGAHALPAPQREERWVRRLFEKAVGGFYGVALANQGWSVRCGNWLSWPCERQTAGMGRLLPSMQTDVVLDHAASGRRIVMDTKFTSIVTRGWHRDESLRSGYLYQIYAYLRSQAGRGDALADRAEGLLLHPSVGDTVDETVLIQGHAIRFATVDLAGTPAQLRARLLALCQPALV